MKTLYLVRHCQSMGQDNDSSLTDAGCEDAKVLTNYLFERGIEVCYTSDTKRSKDSYVGISLTDKRLGGKLLSWENEDNRKEMLKNTFEDMLSVYEGGESGMSAAQRMKLCITDILQSDYRVIAIITHGDILTHYLQLFDKKYGFDSRCEMKSPDVFTLQFDDLSNLVSVENSSLSL